MSDNAGYARLAGLHVLLSMRAQALTCMSGLWRADVLGRTGAHTQLGREALANLAHVQHFQQAI